MRRPTRAQQKAFYKACVAVLIERGLCKRAAPFPGGYGKNGTEYSFESDLYGHCKGTVYEDFVYLRVGNIPAFLESWGEHLCGDFNRHSGKWNLQGMTESPSYAAAMFDNRLTTLGAPDARA